MYLQELSADEMKKVELLKKWMKDENITADFKQYDTYYVIRFLKARKFDMEKA